MPLSSGIVLAGGLLLHTSLWQALPIIRARSHSRCCVQDLGKLGYKYQFVTLAGFHAVNFGMFELASGYKKRGMAAYSELQQQEFAAEARGYTATKHQREVGRPMTAMQAWPVLHVCCCRQSLVPPPGMNVSLSSILRTGRHWLL